MQLRQRAMPYLLSPSLSIPKPVHFSPNTAGNNPISDQTGGALPFPGVTDLSVT